MRVHSVHKSELKSLRFRFVKVQFCIYYLGVAYNRHIISIQSRQFLHREKKTTIQIFDITAPEEHMAHFDYHQGAITSVSWHPNDETGLAIASVDNTISLWDCAVEADEDDDNNMKNDDEDDNMPPQLLFLHQGQREIMECQWHPQVPGMVISTAYDGFNVFKPCKTCNF